MALLTKSLKKRITMASMKDVEELHDYVLGVWFEKVI